MTKQLYYFFICMGLALIFSLLIPSQANTNLPLVAIASYGPHSSLEATIAGFKDQMAAQGFIEGQTVYYERADVGFDPSLIPQMLSSLKSKKPALLVVLTTPVASIAKAKIKKIPLVYAAVTDPVEAGLIADKNQPQDNITGSSEMQNLTDFLQFAKTLLPDAKNVGLLYATSEANDAALVRMMQKSAQDMGLSVVALPIDQPRDVPVRIQDLKNKVDLIYVGTSGPIQPTLPVISAIAKKMHIPLFNADSQAVKEGLALGSFGVDYYKVGKNAGELAVAILNGIPVSELPPKYPTAADHHALVNRKIAQEFQITIPPGIDIVE